jgi:ADP-ribosyl-[dinitrogen reductase] hydrolase
MTIRTSDTDPIRIDVVTIPSTGGQIGLTFCPGKKQMHALTGNWDRNLEQDMQRIADWKPDAMLTLIEPQEFVELDVKQLPEVARRMGLEWHHLPIPDMGVPDAAFERGWLDVGKKLHQYLCYGGRVIVHCKGGLGRAGTIAAKLLVECGFDPENAISQVRLARKHAIETGNQEEYVRALAVSHNDLNCDS